MRKNDIQKIFSKIPELESERLVLRRMQKSDAPDMFEYACLPTVTEYLLWYPHPDLDHTKRYLSMIDKDYRIGVFYDWAVVLKENGKMIGTCGFTDIDTQNFCAEVGYVLNPKYWGEGIAPEAVSTVMRFGFDVLKMHRIEAKYIIGNDRSRRVMEKTGMTFEGIRRSSMLIKGQYRDIGICSIISSEYNHSYYLNSGE